MQCIESEGSVDKDKEIILLLQEAIITYLNLHPHAADTLEGVTQWWLSEKNHYATTPIVQEALDRLIVENRISSKVLSERAVLYFHPDRQNYWITTC